MIQQPSGLTVLRICTKLVVKGRVNHTACLQKKSQVTLLVCSFRSNTSLVISTSVHVKSQTIVLL